MAGARPIGTHSHLVHGVTGYREKDTSGLSSHPNYERAESEVSQVHYREHDHSDLCQYQPNEDAMHKEEHAQPSLVPAFDATTGETSDLEVENITAQDMDGRLSTLMKSPCFSEQEKLQILTSFSSSVLGKIYERHVAKHGRPQLPASTSQLWAFHDAEEDNYVPPEHAVPAPDPTAPPPIYPGYVGHFTTSEQARRYRKRARLPPKSQAGGVDRVRRFGRKYWVRRIYEAMIDITYVSDSDSSIHRQRFVVSATFEPADLEATAHHVFDAALAVHERGWNRPNVYYKKVVRGKLIDVSERSVESRLARICYCLRQKKATVDDAVRGGVTLALLCDNPEARAFTKASNNTGNKKRGERLRKVNRQEDDQDDSE